MVEASSLGELRIMGGPADPNRGEDSCWKPPGWGVERDRRLLSGRLPRGGGRLPEPPLGASVVRSGPC